MSWDMTYYSDSLLCIMYTNTGENIREELTCTFI